MKKYIHFFILFVFLIFGFTIYTLFNFTYITAEFDSIRPIKKAIPVYYKGIIIGKAKELKHSLDYKHVIIHLVLFPKNLLLPSNTIVKLKKEKKKNKEKDFLELIYPDKPSLVMLSNHSKIKGIETTDVETFLANQHPDDLEIIKENLISSAQNLNYALQSLGEIFDNINEILNENKKNINKMTKNIENITKKIDNALNQEKIENTLLNIEESSQNITKTIDDINQILPNVDNSLIQIKEIISNLNIITCAIRKKLSKKFGLMRILFGSLN